MENRIKLQSILENVLKSRNVYFQPPPSIKMSYPAIVYSLSNIDLDRANDISYHKKNRYQIIFITKNPEDPVIEKILDLPFTSFNSSYVSDNLYHYSYTIFY